MAASRKSSPTVFTVDFIANRDAGALASAFDEIWATTRRIKYRKGASTATLTPESIAFAGIADIIGRLLPAL